MSNVISSLTRPAFVNRRAMNLLVLLVLVAVCFLVFCPEADAAPGGQFVKQALSTKFGKIGGLIVGGLFLLAAIILLPLILYVYFAERAGIRKTKSDLKLLAEKYDWFEWPELRRRIEQTVEQIASVWASGNLTSAASFMTPDYFASQQEMLARWVDEGKQIVYRLQKIGRIEPLAVSVEDEETHSWIRVLVTVDCIDYMRDEDTKEVVKGDTGTTTGFESVYVFVHQNGEWLLSGIEKGSSSLTWAKEKNRIETRYLDSVFANRPGARRKSASRTGAKSQSTTADSPANDTAAQPKKRLVRNPARDEDH
jgi:hypothetical protein